MKIIRKPDITWNLKDKILIKENFLSDNVCNELIEYGVQHVKPGIPKYSSVTDRLKYDDCTLPENHYVKDIFEKDWKEIVDFHGFDIDFVEPYIVKRYKTQDFFNPHADYFGASRGQKIDRKFTIIVQLSDGYDYEGGVLTILGNPMPKKRGTLISFPSFYSHAVSLITFGTRWSLINFVWGPYWK